MASFGPAATAVSTATGLPYHGLVEVQVAGIGESEAANDNDAFYVFADGAGNPVGPTHNNSFYQLALDTAPITGAPGVPTPFAQLAKNAIVYDIDGGFEVTPIYVPAYVSDHIYRFVIDTGLTGGFLGGASLLHFGVANGIYADNSGEYRISVWQLETVPEPASLGLFGLGLGLVLAFRRGRT